MSQVQTIISNSIIFCTVSVLVPQRICPSIVFPVGPSMCSPIGPLTDRFFCRFPDRSLHRSPIVASIVQFFSPFPDRSIYLFRDRSLYRSPYCSVLQSATSYRSLYHFANRSLNLFSIVQFYYRFPNCPSVVSTIGPTTGPPERPPILFNPCSNEFILLLFQQLFKSKPFTMNYHQKHLTEQFGAPKARTVH